MNLLQNLHIGSRCLVPTLTLILCGCTVGPDFIRPDPPLAKNYSSDVQTSATLSADGVAQRFLPGTEISTQWWRLFKSPPLDAAVSVALRNSPTLQSAEASLRQSYEKLSAGEGVYYPQVDAGLSAMRMRGAPTQQGTASPISVFNVATLNGSVSYSLDFFGGERRMVESLHAQVDYQRYARTAAYLTLSANVVNTCIARAAYSAQIRATEQLTALETEQLRSIEAQVRAGTSPYANLLSQRSLIAGNEALLAPL